VRITISSAPRTKKTHNRTVDLGARCPRCERGTRTIVLPSESYVDFEQVVAPSLQRMVRNRTDKLEPCKVCKGTLRKSGKKCPGCLATGLRAVLIDRPVLVEAIFYRDADRGDLAGYIQALGDVLQIGGVIRDDELIAGWPLPSDGKLPLRKDADRPRIEIVITPLPEVQPDLFGASDHVH